MNYTKDNLGNKILVNELGDQVMMSWEKEYMNALVDNIKPHGDILEIGFGLGYSATRFLEHNIKSYTVIECDDGVLEEAHKWANENKHIPINIIKGKWQDVLHVTNDFDCFFFDDYPLEREDEDDIRVYDFQYRIMENHVRKNSKLTWYCQVLLWYLTSSDTNYETKKIIVDVPENCKYSVTGKVVFYMPVVTFREGKIKSKNKWAWTKNNEVKNLKCINL